MFFSRKLYKRPPFFSQRKAKYEYYINLFSTKYGIVHFRTNFLNKPDKNKKTIVFIHGWANNWFSFTGVSDLLYKDFNIYILDLLGFGDSSKPEFCNFDVEVNMLSLFIKKVVKKCSALVGVSMGALILSKGVDIFCCEKIILLSPVFRHRSKRRRFIMKSLDKFFRFSLKHKLFLNISEPIIRSKWFSYMLAKHMNTYKFDKKVIDKYGMEGKSKMSIKNYFQLGIDIMNFKIEDVLSKSKNKNVFFIFGDKEKVVDLEVAKKFLDSHGFSYVFVKDAGHIVHIEQPKQVALYIKQFLQK